MGKKAWLVIATKENYLIQTRCGTLNENIQYVSSININVCHFLKQSGDLKTAMD